jgi:hypothetical protein
LGNATRHTLSGGIMLNIDKNITLQARTPQSPPEPVDAPNAAQHPIPLWNNRFLGYTFPPR